MYRLFKLLAALAYLAVGFGGLFLCVRFVLGALGGAAAVLAAVLFPLTLAVAPWVALFRDGAWGPLAAVYGGILVAGLLHAVARTLERRSRRRAGPPTEARSSGEAGP